MADSGLGALSDFITGLAGKIPGQYDAMSSGISNAVAGSRQADDQFIGKLNDLQTQGNQSPGLAFASGVMGNGWLTKGMGEGLANYNTALTQQRAEQLDRAGKIQALQIAKANLDRAAAGEQIANTKDALSMPNTMVGGMQGVGNLNWLTGVSGSGLPQTKMQSAAPPVLGATNNLGSVASGAPFNGQHVPLDQLMSSAASDGSNASQPTGQQSPSQDLSNPVQPSPTANAPISMTDPQNPMPAQVSGQMPPQSAVPIGQGQQGSAQQGQQGQSANFDPNMMFARDVAMLKAYQANPQTFQQSPMAMQMLEAAYKRYMDSPAFKGSVKGAEGGADASARLPFNMIENEAKNASAANYDLVTTQNPQTGQIELRPKSAVLGQVNSPPPRNAAPISFGQASDDSGSSSQPAPQQHASNAVLAPDPNSGKRFELQAKPWQESFTDAALGRQSLAQAQQMMDVMFDANGKPTINTGPSGPFINDAAAYMKQAGFSESFLDSWLHTNPDNAQALEKLKTAMGTEIAKQTIGPGSQLRVTEFNQFLKTTPGEELLPNAFKWIVQNSIIPKAQQQIGRNDAVKDLDPAKDNIMKALNEYDAAHPVYTPRNQQSSTSQEQGQPQASVNKTTTTPAAVIAPKYEENQTATGPKGEKVIFKSGKWVTNQ